MKRSAVVVALAVALSACGPKNYVVLLDNPGGGSGKVIVSNDKGRQVLDKSGSATTIDRRTRAPSSPWELSVEKIRDVFAGAFGARPARFKKYTLYFRSGSRKIEDGSKSQIEAMLAEVQRRPGVDVTVAGHADRKASDKLNIKISFERANTVRDMLMKAGVPSERIEIDGYGETMPAVPTADNVAEQRNRRVEVTVR